MDELGGGWRGPTDRRGAQAVDVPGADPDREGDGVLDGPRRGAGWVIVNNTSANAATRPLEHPAPTMYFGARLNSMWWRRA